MYKMFHMCTTYCLGFVTKHDTMPLISDREIILIEGNYVNVGIDSTSAENTSKASVLQLSCPLHFLYLAAVI